MKTTKIFFLFLCVVFSFNIDAQTQTILYPNLEDNALLNAVQSGFTPTSVMGYGEARDVMFGVIDNDNNNVTCVYTGHRLYLDPNVDPSTGVYMGGLDEGINTEHTYPQSKGAFGNAKSDLHHLFPTKIPVNSARGSDPFQDINDNITEKWFRNETVYNNIPPASVIDECSEDTNTAFEPREDHKGDVARAMFYFYTIYRDNALSSDPNYFESQRATLIKWHHDDPVSVKEYERTNKIAEYQGQVNPFVIDSTLAYRLYCDGISDSYCDVTVTTATENIEPIIAQLGQNYPNPFGMKTVIPYQLKEAVDVKLEIIDVLGKTVEVLLDKKQSAGDYEVEWTRTVNHQNIYYYKLTIKKNEQIEVDIKRML